MYSKVINGEYKDWDVKRTLKGQVIVQWFTKRVVIDETTVDSYEILDKTEGKASVGKTIGLGAMFGVVGAVAGANSKKGAKTTVKINWKDGKKSIIEFDESTLKAFLSVCPL